MPKPERTNAMRLLDSRKIPYVAHAFSPEIHSAEGVAQALGFPPSQVFKTLVTLSESPRAKPVLAIIPGDAELDLKKLAKLLGEKKMRMATQREAESLTGLQVGGISALALLTKGFRVVVDASALSWERVLVSAGQRGLNLELAPQDLIALVAAQVGEVTTAPTNP
ncbi:MAG: aminoacyl-tRNA deacylase [Chloroflexi bacterium]|nr:aminoacyl-tRNA deacylase [Chloroflexota bacterium]